jgi:hypothetical protein
MTDERQKELLKNAIGPAPWYWETFPRPRGASGKQFEWRFHGKDGELAYLVSLHLPGESITPRMALNTYCRPFAITSDMFGVASPEGRNLRLTAFDPDSLKAFDFVEIAGWFKNSTERIYAATAPIAEFEIPTTLGEGTHPFEFPEEFKPITELLLVTSTPSTEPENPSAAIFVLYPHAGLIEVLPQRWFTPMKFNIGHQWITRVTRDPESHRIIGDGIRIGSFELTDDGKGLRRWIEEEAAT